MNYIIITSNEDKHIDGNMVVCGVEKIGRYMLWEFPSITAADNGEEVLIKSNFSFVGRVK